MLLLQAANGAAPAAATSSSNGAVPDAQLPTVPLEKDVFELLKAAAAKQGRPISKVASEIVRNFLK